MSAMPQLPPEKTRPGTAFPVVLLIGWAVLGAAGLVYARWKGIPGWAAGPLLAAFLVEFPFYLVPAFPAIRERIPPRHLAAYVFTSAAMPYLVCCAGAAQFQWAGLARVAALALALALWFVVLPRRWIFDLQFPPPETLEHQIGVRPKQSLIFGAHPAVKGEPGAENLFGWPDYQSALGR